MLYREFPTGNPEVRQKKLPPTERTILRGPVHDVSSTGGSAHNPTG